MGVKINTNCKIWTDWVAVLVCKTLPLPNQPSSNNNANDNDDNSDNNNTTTTTTNNNDESIRNHTSNNEMTDTQKTNYPWQCQCDIKWSVAVMNYIDIAIINPDGYEFRIDK